MAAPSEVESVTIRFAGDSGDGVQLTGSRFTVSTALAGNDLSTFPDFPAEIRAPAGTIPGVSGFQIHFSSNEVLTPGDKPDILVAFNPAALKANFKDLPSGGTILVNQDAFTPGNLKKANFDSNPLDDGSLSAFRVIPVPMGKLTNEAVKGFGLAPAQASRCKNFFALGIMYWLYGRSLESTEAWIKTKFQRVQAMVDANIKVLHAGHAFAETAALFERTYRVKKAAITPGRYRNITGNEATVLGLVTAARQAEHPLFYASYPITPASDILHGLSKLKAGGVRTFQAEDEIAAACAAIGASFAGHLAVTGTSGPGLALKAEAIGLAVITELPLVVIDVQRGGPSTGLPTKTEQSDLLQALHGRNGESPVAVLAASTPSDCFETAMTAAFWAMKYRHPVILLTDGFLANGSEPWKIPDIATLAKLKISHEPPVDLKGFRPYARDPETLARPWVLPGTPGCEHRIGGLEKDSTTGNVSYDPKNHEFMVRIRVEKVAGMAREIPPTKILGRDEGKLLVVGWGSTYGAVTMAVRQLQAEGKAVSAVHLRHLNPLAPDLESVFKRFKKVLVPELNLGQLLAILRSKFDGEFEGLNSVEGRPLKVEEVKEKLESMMGDRDAG